jgi:hypothetical protein
MPIAIAFGCAICLMLALLRRRDPARRQRLLAAALDPDRKAMRFRATATTKLLDPWQWWPMFVPAFFPFVMLVFAGGRFGDLVLCIAGAALLAAAALVTARDSERWWKGKAVHVGTDGVFIEAPKESRFIPFRDIAELDKWSVLVLRSSEKLRLVADPRDGLSLHLRIERALARSREQRAPTARARAFVAASSAEAYRSDAMTTDEALDVLEDPSALEAQRVAAATWLQRAPDRDNALSRLRVVAHETASPQVRIAVETVEAAIAPLDDDGGAATSATAARGP